MILVLYFFSSDLNVPLNQDGKSLDLWYLEIYNGSSSSIDIYWNGDINLSISPYSTDMIPIDASLSISFDVSNIVGNVFKFTGYDSNQVIIQNFYGSTNPIEMLEGYVSYTPGNSSNTTVLVEQTKSYEEGGSFSLCYINMYPDNKFNITVDIILN